MRRVPRILGSVFLALTALGAVAAHAVDGVLEIGQTCAVSTGCGPGDLPGFPVSITRSGSYRLVADLELPTLDTTAILVSANHVTIDLNGFSIRPREDCTPDCGAPGLGTGILAPQIENLAVRNGTLFGLGQDGLRTGDYAQIADVRIFGVGGTGIVTGSHSEIRNTTVASTGVYGIQAEHDVAILDSLVRAAATDGVVAAGTPLISRTRIQNNGGMGVRIDGAGGSVLDNVLAGNGNLAIQAHDAVFANNMLSQNGFGLFFFAGQASVIRSNAFSQSPAVDVASTRNALLVDNAIHGSVNASYDDGTNGNVLGASGGSSLIGGEAIAPSVCDGTLGCP
ncbi:MAG: hypothetical protein KC616_17860 [Myxococcales bacterium]|nr:hypothetical protein [Myxococcales bacterium]